MILHKEKTRFKSNILEWIYIFYIIENTTNKSVKWIVGKTCIDILEKLKRGILCIIVYTMCEVESKQW